MRFWAHIAFNVSGPLVHRWEEIGERSAYPRCGRCKPKLVECLFVVGPGDATTVQQAPGMNWCKACVRGLEANP